MKFFYHQLNILYVDLSKIDRANSKRLRDLFLNITQRQQIIKTNKILIKSNCEKNLKSEDKIFNSIFILRRVTGHPNVAKCVHKIFNYSMCKNSASENNKYNFKI